MMEEEARKKGKPRSENGVLRKAARVSAAQGLFFCLQRGYLHKVHQFHNENVIGENTRPCPKAFSWREWYSVFESERRALVARSFK